MAALSGRFSRPLSRAEDVVRLLLRLFERVGVAFDASQPEVVTTTDGGSASARGGTWSRREHKETYRAANASLELTDLTEILDGVMMHDLQGGTWVRATLPNGNGHGRVHWQTDDFEFVAYSWHGDAVDELRRLDALLQEIAAQTT
jgi:hypothetical protein